jgi:hypothetical protein
MSTRLAMYAATKGKMRNELKSLLGRPRRRRQGNTKTTLKGIGCVGMIRLQLAQDRVEGWDLVNTE